MMRVVVAPLKGQNRVTGGEGSHIKMMRVVVAPLKGQNFLDWYAVPFRVWSRKNKIRAIH